MTELPILFSAPMVRVILEGSKTQTRRIVKPQPMEEDGQIYDGRIFGPEIYEPVAYDKNGEMVPGPEIYGIYTEDGDWGIKCPYGKVGDHLWVRETFCDATSAEEGRILYRADGDIACKWVPSIHMPRKASRIQLAITAIRVERLQNISEADAVAEGCKAMPGCKWHTFAEADAGIPMHDHTAKDAYMALWETINGEGSWDANPWVWVVDFKVLKP
jgi:hypothetical protein